MRDSSGRVESRSAGTRSARRAVVVLAIGLGGTLVPEFARAWQKNVRGELGGNGTSVAVDATGDIIGAGTTANKSSSPVFAAALRFAVIKLLGSDGGVLWQQSLDGGASALDEGTAVSVDAAGDVVVAGYSVPFYEQASAMALDGAGHAVAVGRTTSTPGSSDLTVLALREEISGHSLRFTDWAGNPAARKLTVISKDPGIIGAGPGGPADPTVGGATLELVNPNTGERDQFALPADNWQAIAALPGSTAIPRAFLYHDPTRAAGPRTKVAISSDGRFKASCQGPLIQFSLDEQSQGALRVDLKAATGATLHCMLFGGRITKDRPGLFKASAADAPTACPGP